MEKPPILFLHGAFAGPEIWTRFVAPWFAARGHQVSVPRLPGALPGARLRDYVRRARARGRRARRAAGGGRPFARRARRPAPRGAAPGRRRRAGRLARPLRPRRRRSGSSRRGRPTCSPRCCSPRPAPAGCSGIEAVRRALFTEDTPRRLDRRGRRPARPREPAGAPRRADLGPAGLVPGAAGRRCSPCSATATPSCRSPTSGRSRWPTAPRPSWCAAPPTACRSTRTGGASPGASTPGSTSAASAAAAARRSRPAGRGADAAVGVAKAAIGRLAEPAVGTASRISTQGHQD